MLRTFTALLCFSHLRWDFVFQRPQHVISRFGREQPAFFWEEPEPTDRQAFLESRTDDNVTVLKPRLPSHLTREEQAISQRRLLDAFISEHAIDDALLWYYTPMALEFTRHLHGLCVYDCMDELSMFKGAPPSLTSNERDLLARADVVFTGGRSLYYSKRRAHGNVHCFPSAVEAQHFAKRGNEEPDDMRALKHPRIGFYGVIDERFDLEFVRELALELDDWQLVFLGPVVKIDPTQLPQAANIHYLGMKTYAELPAYLEHWDVALLPFAQNDATRFISPTKTLEYLAARRPVISTPIADVVDPYGTEGIVMIAETPQAAASAARLALHDGLSQLWHTRVDELLASISWDRTVSEMRARIAQVSRREVEVAG